MFDRVLGEMLEDERSPFVVCNDMGLSFPALVAWINEGGDERIKKYLNAWKVRTEVIGEKAQKVADGHPVVVLNPDGTPFRDEDGNLVLHQPDVARDRLRVDTMFKRAKAYNPALFGDKKEVNVSVGVDVDAKLGESLNAILARVVEGEVVPARLSEATPEDQEI
jgi:hypothetical protein